MAGDCEMGTCGVCKKEKVILQRTYFHYDIKCECHSPNHFEIVRHCGECKPIQPTETKIYLRTDSLLQIK
jgi:hypothetical protein